MNIKVITYTGCAEMENCFPLFVYHVFQMNMMGFYWATQTTHDDSIFAATHTSRDAIQCGPH